MTFWGEGAPKVDDVVDLRIAGKVGDLPARLYRHGSCASAPLVIYLHGGGWVRGSLSLSDWICRSLARESKLSVLAATYRLSPKHRFPAAIEDVSAVVDWAGRHGDRHGLATNAFLLAGASAGANLALATTLWRRDRGFSKPKGLALFYGTYGSDLDTESFKRFADGRYGLNKQASLEHLDAYTAGVISAENPSITPLNADLSGLPPTWIAAAELDVRRDDSVALARPLDMVGVANDLVRYRGLVHAFTIRAKMVPRVEQAYADAAALLSRSAALS